MKEGTKSPAQLHAERKLFVEQAMQKDALSGMNRKKVDIGLMYTFNDELTLADIARQVYPQDKSGRANTSLQLRGFITTLFDRVSYALEPPYKLEDLLAKKPRREESVLRIRDLILQGAKSVDELEKQSGLPRGNIWNDLRRLEEWGIDVSQFSSTTRKDREKIQQLIKEKDDKRIQKIMDGLSYGVVSRNMKEPRERKKRRNPRVFVTIGRVTSGIYRYNFTQTHLFAQDLEETGIPNRIVEVDRKERKNLTYVLLEKHRDRALAAWKKNPKLEQFKINPVSVVCGNTSADVPTITQLSQREDYRPIFSILSDLAIRIPPQHQVKFRKWLFEGCPITVWAYRGERYVAASDTDQFKQYFLGKSTQLRRRVGSKNLTPIESG